MKYFSISFTIAEKKKKTKNETNKSNIYAQQSTKGSHAMKIAIAKETFPGERRVPLIPADVEKLVKKGAVVEIEPDVGEGSGYDDEQYRKVGASPTADRKKMFSEADILLRLRKPPAEDIALLKKGAIHISYLDPFNEKELIDKFVKTGISAISMEMIPRTTKAQKMDALSSQASLAGYVAVIEAMKQLDKIFPISSTIVIYSP